MRTGRESPQLPARPQPLRHRTRRSRPSFLCRLAPSPSSALRQRPRGGTAGARLRSTRSPPGRRSHRQASASGAQARTARAPGPSANLAATCSGPGARTRCVPRWPSRRCCCCCRRCRRSPRMVSGGPGPAGTPTVPPTVPVHLRLGGLAEKPAAPQGWTHSSSCRPPALATRGTLTLHHPRPFQTENAAGAGPGRGLSLVSVRVEWAVDCAGADGGAPALNGFAGKESRDLGHREAPGFRATLGG